MNNHSYIVSHFNKEKGVLEEQEIDDFWIGGHPDDNKETSGCTILYKGKLIFHGPVSTTHPTSSHDAILAIDEFRNKTAVEMVKEHK